MTYEASIKYELELPEAFPEHLKEQIDKHVILDICAGIRSGQVEGVLNIDVNVAGSEINLLGTWILT